MNVSYPHPWARALAALGAACILVSLTGCQGEKIVARVGSRSITESEFVERAKHMRAEEILPSLDAGGSALASIIKERLTSLVAEEKKVNVSDDDVVRLTAYQMKFQPQLEAALKRGMINQDDLQRASRLAYQEFGIGTDAAHVDDKEIQAEYEKLKGQPALVLSPANPTQMSRNAVKVPEMWVMRILVLPSEIAAQQALALLNQTKDFRQTAMKLGISAQQSGDERYEFKEVLQKGAPSLVAELDKLTVGQISPKPIPLSTAQQQVPGMDSTRYIVAQILEKKPEYVFKLEEAHFPIEQMLLQRKNPGWFQHKDQELAKYTSELLNKNGIQIHVKQYQPELDKYVRRMSENYSATAPGGTLNQGGAMPQTAPGGGAPGEQPSAGGGAPGASGAPGTPTGGATAPSGAAPPAGEQPK